MPLAVATALTLLKHDRPFGRDFWRRIIDFKRIGYGWFLVIFQYAPVRSGLAALIDGLMGGQGIAPEAVSRLVAQPILIVPPPLFLAGFRSDTRRAGVAWVCTRWASGPA
jgi:hypothetical protein